MPCTLVVAVTWMSKLMELEKGCSVLCVNESSVKSWELDFLFVFVFTQGLAELLNWPGCAWTCSSPASASQSPGVTCACHGAQFKFFVLFCFIWGSCFICSVGLFAFWDGISSCKALNALCTPGWPQTWRSLLPQSPKHWITGVQVWHLEELFFETN